ncbi:MAG: serine/threonine-protein kinase [Gemmatimonadota bacterium]|jgi:serine/threonine-protein kinase
MTGDVSGPGPEGGDRLERLYERALALPVGEREAFLDEACGGDPELRAELVSLLAHGAGADSFMEDVGRLVEPSIEGPPEELVEALADRYVIERELGAGGMATVYLAEDLKHDRRVALKVLKPVLAAVVGADRFLAEIKTTANLQHPHVLPLYDSGEANGFLYYVMPYMEGESLRQRLDRERQPPVDDAVRIATNVAEALDYAHQHGVIHRDIKPANILLQAGKAVVSDFGIALAVSLGGGSRITETGLSLGTPRYMSPEQAAGDRIVGATADVYSLGCVLYEMLTGEPPYRGATLQALMSRVLAGDAVPPCDLRTSTPPHVDAAVRRAIEKIPADRFRSAREFARALGDRSFRHGPTRAGETPVAGHWRPAALAGWVAAGLLAASLAWSAFQPEDLGEVERYPIDAPESWLYSAHFDISSDGRAIVFRGRDAGSYRLFLWRLEALEATPIPGTRGANGPAISPDDEQVAFVAEGRLAVTRLEGGRVRVLTDSARCCRHGRTTAPSSSPWHPTGRPPGSILATVSSRESWRRAGRVRRTCDSCQRRGVEAV